MMTITTEEHTQSNILKSSLLIFKNKDVSLYSIHQVNYQKSQQTSETQDMVISLSRKRNWQSFFFFPKDLLRTDYGIKVELTDLQQFFPPRSLAVAFPRHNDYIRVKLPAVTGN